LAELFCDRGRLGEAQTHAERAKLHAINDTCDLGRAMELQARIWDKQGRFEEARSEELCAVGVFEKLGTAKELEGCRNFLQDIEGRMKTPVVSGESDLDGELPKTVPLPTPANSPSSAQES
jgi:hypothetical protein